MEAELNARIQEIAFQIGKIKRNIEMYNMNRTLENSNKKNMQKTISISVSNEQEGLVEKQSRPPADEKTPLNDTTNNNVEKGINSGNEIMNSNPIALPSSSLSIDDAWEDDDIAGDSDDDEDHERLLAMMQSDFTIEDDITENDVVTYDSSNDTKVCLYNICVITCLCYKLNQVSNISYLLDINFAN
jgi:recombination DNA repair RAD52 pathway protein